MSNPRIIKKIMILISRTDFSPEGRANPEPARGGKRGSEAGIP